jgi:hypothetical protein
VLSPPANDGEGAVKRAARRWSGRTRVFMKVSEEGLRNSGGEYKAHSVQRRAWHAKKNSPPKRRDKSALGHENYETHAATRGDKRPYI